ncbi:hypothetical protein B0J17DRAFT_628920 [Rhizoctonia solani]|nr:hypothetical protein B0J17DRAFT_628920 [Rhizoctonia solani]
MPTESLPPSIALLVLYSADIQDFPKREFKIPKRADGGQGSRPCTRHISEAPRSPRALKHTLALICKLRSALTSFPVTHFIHTWGGTIAEQAKAVGETGRGAPRDPGTEYTSSVSVKGRGRSKAERGARARASASTAAKERLRTKQGKALCSHENRQSSGALGNAIRLSFPETPRAYGELCGAPVREVQQLSSGIGTCAKCFKTVMAVIRRECVQSHFTGRADGTSVEVLDLPQWRADGTVGQYSRLAIVYHYREFFPSILTMDEIR